MLHIVFTDDGIPGWIGSSAIAGSVPVDTTFISGDAIEFLASHRRRPNGTWVKRTKVVPTPEELETARQYRIEARKVMRQYAIKQALAEATPELMAEMLENGHPKEWFIAQRQAIRDQFRPEKDEE